MTTENDWFMRQIKGAANMLGSALRLTIQHLDLGQFEDEQGRQLDGADYLQELLEIPCLVHKIFKSHMDIIQEI